MPASVIKGIAKRTGKSEEEVEAHWNDIKEGLSKSMDENDPKFYPVLVSTLKKRLSEGVKISDVAKAFGILNQGDKSSDGRHYGWSHIAYHGYKSGDKVEKGDLGRDKTKNRFPYIILNDKEAKEHALRFHKEVS